MTIEGSGLYLVLMDPDPGGPKTYGSYRSGQNWTYMACTTMNIKASCLGFLAEGAAFLGAARHTLGAEYAATARKHHLLLILYTRPMDDTIT